ncbi:hypothetical protein [Asticcacaulis sp. AND118]|nr:hypothetical protein [Asticcacaulis sp. AND118]UDF02906.1 hypothetical protein LH365_10745 [Asticcacaulis sp. AND118]
MTARVVPAERRASAIATMIGSMLALFAVLARMPLALHSQVLAVVQVAE